VPVCGAANGDRTGINACGATILGLEVAMSERFFTALWIAFAVVAAACMSFGLSLAGEPHAVWLWRNVLGALR